MSEYEIITLLIACIALIVSLYGVVISKQSSNKSLEIQKVSLRPFLNVSIVKNNDTGRYFDIIRYDNVIVWKINVQIENTSNLPANNIKLPDYCNVKDISSLDKDIAMNIGDIVLGPKQKYAYEILLEAQSHNEDYIKDIILRDKGLSFKFVVNYGSVLDEITRYKTVIFFDIQKDKVSTLSNSQYT